MADGASCPGRRYSRGARAPIRPIRRRHRSNMSPPTGFVFATLVDPSHVCRKSRRSATSSCSHTSSSSK